MRRFERASAGLVWAAFGVFAFPGIAAAARFETQNFVVTARSSEVARQVGEYAEQYRREKALQWLGQELPPWTKACSIDVKLTMGGAGGATSFDFDGGVVRYQQMHVEGPLDRVLDSVLPHEITHTIFAAKFRRPLPRWADEGGAVLSEDYSEKRRHDLLVREIINGGRMIPLRRLFILTEYPRDVMALYAQGFSVANFLVSLKGRQEFLEFVGEGQAAGWDAAAEHHYGISRVELMEQRWIAWIIAGKGTGADQQPIAATIPATRRPTAPSASPRVVRGQMPQEDDDRYARRQPAKRPVVAVGDSASTPIPSAKPRGAASAVGRNSDPPAPPAPAVVTSALATETSGTITGAKVVAAESNEPAAEAESDDPPKRQLVPIAVGRARRNHSIVD